MKPVIMWAVVAKNGYMPKDYIKPTRVEVIDHCTRSATPQNTREKIMRKWRREGYRVVKVEVREVGND